MSEIDLIEYEGVYRCFATNKFGTAVTIEATVKAACKRFVDFTSLFTLDCSENDLSFKTFVDLMIFQISRHDITFNCSSNVFLASRSD